MKNKKESFLSIEDVAKLAAERLKLVSGLDFMAVVIKSVKKPKSKRKIRKDLRFKFKDHGTRTATRCAMCGESGSQFLLSSHPIYCLRCMKIN